MLKQPNKYFQAVTLFTFLFCTFLAFGQIEIPARPKLQTSVYDDAKLLNSNEIQLLERKLINYADSTSTQIVVATINSLHGENISLYATEWAHKWGIGQADKDNGMIVLVAKSDRKLAIQTGYGVEHLLTDNLAKRIITNIITPEFKKGNFYGGLDRGTSAIIQIMNGEYEERRDFGGDAPGKLVTFFIVLFFIIVLIIVLSNRNRGGGSGGRRYRDGRAARSLLEAIILSKAGRGGFSGGGFGGSSGGGSFGGGGFGGGFGGGGFGGGGASGGW